MPEQQAGLLTAFEHEGVWWTPDNTSNRVSGTLSYDPGSGARLDLLGHLTPEQTAFSGTRIGSPTMTIHGFTKDGKPVTLDGVYTFDYQISPNTESFRSKRVLIGEHLEAPESSLFCFCQFRFTNMEEWLSTRAFNLNLKNATEPYEFTLSCQTQSVSTYRVEPIGANLKTAGSFQTHDITPRHYGITVQSWFVLTPDEGRPLSWYTDIITRMRNLAALCLGQPAYIEEIGLFTCDSSGTQGPRIDVYYVQNPSPPARRAIDIQEPLLSLPGFGDQIETVLDLWFAVCETVNPALNLFFAVFFGAVRHIDVRFVLLTQAVEAFHRLTNDSTYIRGEDYAKAIKPIRKAIPKKTPYQT